MVNPDMYEDVRKFHLKFGLPTADDGEPPQILEFDIADFRKKFLREELDEFETALDAGDLAGMADALVDLVYVALGTAHFMRLPFDELWHDVQRANMAKVRARNAFDSKRGTILDVVKPEGWTGPRTEEILERAVEQPRRAYPVPKVGTWVKTLVDFCDVPKGTKGVVDEDYGTGIMVAWEPLPPGYLDRETGRPDPRRPRHGPDAPLRDGFDKATELRFLEVASW